jgi:hypothetical protein
VSISGGHVLLRTGFLHGFLHVLIIDEGFIFLQRREYLKPIPASIADRQKPILAAYTQGDQIGRIFHLCLSTMNIF